MSAVARACRFAWFVCTVAFALLVLPPRGVSALPVAPADAPAVEAGAAVPDVPGDYVVTQRGPLTIAYAPGLAAGLAPVIAAASLDAQAVADHLGLAAIPAIEIRFVPDERVMRSLAPPDAPPPDYASGVAYPALRLILVAAMAPVSHDPVPVRRVLRHELAHVLLESTVEPASVPRWFSEGVAVTQSDELPFERFQALAFASFTGGLVSWGALDGAFRSSGERVQVAYAESADIVAYLMRTGGEGRFDLALARMRDSGSFETALGQVYGRPIDALEREWRIDARARLLTAPLWAGGSALWMVVIVLMVVGYVRRKRRARLIIRKWEVEEARARGPRRFLVLVPGFKRDSDPAPPAGSPPDKRWIN